MTCLYCGQVIESFAPGKFYHVRRRLRGPCGGFATLCENADGTKLLNTHATPKGPTELLVLTAQDEVFLAEVKVRW
jgi:hypothetical protein